MNTLMEDLRKLIAKQIVQYKKLLIVLRKEKEIIINSSIDELHTNNKKKEVVILQIKLLDETCLKVLEKIYDIIPTLSGQPSLSSIPEMIQEPHFELLSPAYTHLISLVRSAKTLNSDNERLMKGSLRVIKSSISFLMSCATSPKGSLYENSGQIKTENVGMQLFESEV